MIGVISAYRNGARDGGGDNMNKPEMKSKGTWVDISVPVRTGMVVYPTDSPVAVVREMDMARGERVNLSRVSMGSHAGTHVDAPLHCLPDGIPVDRIPLDRLTGTARVVHVADGQSIGPEAVEGAAVEAGQMVLFKTRNSALWRIDRFVEDYVYLSGAAARRLLQKGVAAVGIDYLSIDRYGGGLDAHTILLGASVPVIEGLDLSAVEAGLYECICLPLLLQGAEGAPARVIVRAIGLR
jgi:arylformamidase